ncbi:rod shape-determining protein MreD [Anaerosacchariphilus sp. NSJ-68]|uniref:Rod shape-determining protein MreD n=2 Tax=Lachnospiraceae TaxID=186803 RepID=A0A923LDQ4_9FIRM|nr:MULTISPECIES: rod shape-determining protein MreD [Lachnospiraceae]MBC5660212.1 rod shape-determining protein MreD [Anaerosacchariphilus hominis]MBC5699327.1 rod shape-determining protein MreD [Roseburia difficilis]
MKRKAVMAVLIIITFLLQCTVFQTLALGGISPNLLVILTSSMGFMRGEKEGMAVGFFSGLLTDVFFGKLFGFYTLLYLFLGYGSGLFHMMFYDDDIKLPMTWIALSELVYGLSVYFFMFLMRSRFDFAYYFLHIILPELIYTVVLTLLLYRLIQRLNRFLDRLDEDTAATDYSAYTAGPAETDKQTEEL